MAALLIRFLSNAGRKLFFPLSLCQSSEHIRVAGCSRSEPGSRSELCKQSLSPDRIKHLYVSSLKPNIVILNQPPLQTEMQKCYCHFFLEQNMHVTCLPFHVFKASLGGSSKPTQHPLLLTVKCLEVGQVLAAHYVPGGPRSVTQDSPATPSFLESLAG